MRTSTMRSKPVVMAAILALAVLAAFLLIGAGANILLRRRDDRKRGWLMIAAGLVTLANVALYASTPPQL